MKIALFEFEKTNLISWVIRIATNSIYSHAALIDDNGNVYDSSETIGKVSYRGTLETFEDRNVLLFDLPDEHNKLPNYINRTLGVKYDWKGVIGWLFKCNNRHKFYCFEYVWEWLLVIGMVSSRRRQTSGNDILKALEQYKTYDGSVSNYLKLNPTS